MPKFFVQPEHIQGDLIHLEGENVNHIKNVLRLTIGDKILINDGQGKDYKCIISALEAQKITVRIEMITANAVEPVIKTVLFQSLIKGEKMEWVIQKSVEIGVTEIVPLCTTRCVVKLDTPKKMQSKIERWNKIAESAAKQSGRGVVPIVREPMPFEVALDYMAEQNGLVLIPYEKEDRLSIRTALQETSTQTFGILIGPEGGFTEEEVAKALAKDAQAVTLGKRILRSETASLVALTSIMYETGEMD